MFKQAKFKAKALIAASLMTLPLLSAAPAWAAEYPDRPIRVVVPFPPGGSTDVTARLLSDHLGRALGQTVVVENRPGANGNIAATAVARADPDGYTLLFGTTGTLSINASLYPQLKLDTLRDFDPVAMACIARVVLVARPDLPANTLPELIDLAKSQPDSLTYSSTGTGGIAHLAAEMLKDRADIEVRHIPYKGATPAMQDLLGGRVDFMFDALVTSLPQIEAERLKVLAIPSDSRFPALPNVPTFSEAGIENFDASVWNGFVAPVGTPEEIVARLNAEVNKILADPAVREQLAKQGLEALPMSPAEFRERLSADTEKWAAVVKATGATLD